MTPEQRVLRSRMAAHTLFSKVDAREHTKAARAAFDARFEREVDPDGVLPVAERRRRAGQARKAYFAQLAYRSSRARKAK